MESLVGGNSESEMSQTRVVDEFSSPDSFRALLLTQAPMLPEAASPDSPMDEKNDDMQESASDALSPSFITEAGEIVHNQMSPKTHEARYSHSKFVLPSNCFQDIADEGEDAFGVESLCTQSPTKNESRDAYLTENRQCEATVKTCSHAHHHEDYDKNQLAGTSDELTTVGDSSDNKITSATDETQVNYCLQHDDNTPIIATITSGANFDGEVKMSALADSSDNNDIPVAADETLEDCYLNNEEDDGDGPFTQAVTNDGNDEVEISTAVDSNRSDDIAVATGETERDYCLNHENDDDVSFGTTRISDGRNEKIPAAAVNNSDGNDMTVATDHMEDDRYLNSGHALIAAATTSNEVNTPVNSHDGSTSEDSSSSEEDKSYPIPLLSLEERRVKRVANNNARLENLGLYKFTLQMKKRGRKKREVDEFVDAEEEEEHRGMMFDTHIGAAQDDVLIRYPGRETQIRQLRSTMNATVAQLEDREEIMYVPPPLFIQGPGGSGKTSVVQEVVKSVLLSPRIGSAYINCATLEPSSIEALVENAYRQIARTFKEKKEEKRKKRKRRRKLSKRNSPMTRISVVHEEPEYNETNEVEMEDRVEQARALHRQPEDETQPIATEEEASTCRRRSSRQVNSAGPVAETLKKVAMSSNSRDEIKAEASSYASHGAPLAFGRSLEPFLGKDADGCAFFVLDHAERLMTLAPNRTISQRSNTNYLSQLLLLPKVMGLRLSVIVISRSSLLMNSRIDNASSVDKSSGTLNIGVHPIRIHFPAYAGNETFKTILKTPENIVTMTGSGYNCNTAFHQLLINSFLSALVQAMSGMTRDVRDMLYSGRRLWPLYIKPLSSDNIEETMKVVSDGQADSQMALISYLNQRMVKLSKNIESSLLSLGDDSAFEAISELPYLSKFLLLAAFLCQHNKADKDKQLFTITGNGRRKKQQQDEGESENAAYATWDQQRLRMLRLRSFPLERMLSIFVNLVGLHEGKELILSTGTTTSSFLSSLGNSVFLETLGQLRASGLLREITIDGETALSAAMYCCDMGRDDAESLAASVGFSLEEYLL